MVVTVQLRSGAHINVKKPCKSIDYEAFFIWGEFRGAYLLYG